VEKVSPTHPGMPGEKGEVWVKGKATSHHCMVQKKGRKGLGGILEKNSLQTAVIVSSRQ